MKPSVHQATPIDLATIPSVYRLTVAAWAAGVDLSAALPRSTLYRHAEALHRLGFDIIARKYRRHETHANPA